MPADESSYPDPRTGGVIDIAAVTAMTMSMPTPVLTGHARVPTTSPRLGTHPAEFDRSAGTRRPATPSGNRAGSTITLGRHLRHPAQGRRAPPVTPATPASSPPLATLTTRLWRTGFS